MSRKKRAETLAQKIRKDVLPAKIHDIGEKPCIIVDAMHLAYRVKFTHKNLTFKGKGTGIMFGFLNALKTLILTERPGKIVICWDGFRNPKRIELLPNYKGHRVKEPKEYERFLKQVERTKKLLHYMGITQAHNPEVEGDDMVYLITKKTMLTYPVVIYSGDKDFKQLINKDVSVLNPREKYNNSYHTFLIDHSINIYQYIDYLCLVGDDSDDIPGYRGIGPARAKAFLQKYSSIKDYLDSDDEYSGLLDKDKLREIWVRNRMLMDLKRFNEKYHTPKDITYYRGKSMPKQNIVKFNGYAAKYGLKTFLTETFKKPFIDLYNA